jgi:hypothetical protein
MQWERHEDPQLEERGATHYHVLSTPYLGSRTLLNSLVVS